MTSDSLGELLRLIRHSRGLTQREFASRTGLKPSYLALLETGRRNRPDKALIEKIVKNLQLSEGEARELFRAGGYSPTRADPLPFEQETIRVKNPDALEQLLRRLERRESGRDSLEPPRTKAAETRRTHAAHMGPVFLVLAKEPPLPIELSFDPAAEIDVDLEGVDHSPDLLASVVLARRQVLDYLSSLPAGDVKVLLAEDLTASEDGTIPKGMAHLTISASSPMWIYGGSGGLAFAVAFAESYVADVLSGLGLERDDIWPPIVATGGVGDSGAIEPVAMMAEKSRAVRLLAEGELWFFVPTSDQSMTPDLKQELVDSGIRVHSVASVYEAIDILLSRTVDRVLQPAIGRISASLSGALEEYRQTSREFVDFSEKYNQLRTYHAMFEVLDSQGSELARTLAACTSLPSDMGERSRLAAELEELIEHVENPEQAAREMLFEDAAERAQERQTLTAEQRKRMKHAFARILRVLEPHLNRMDAGQTQLFSEVLEAYNQGEYGVVGAYWTYAAPEEGPDRREPGGTRFAWAVDYYVTLTELQSHFQRSDQDLAEKYRVMRPYFDEATMSSIQADLLTDIEHAADRKSDLLSQARDLLREMRGTPQ